MAKIDIRCGDSLAELAKIPDGSIQSCITSPPYWGLRDYGTATWEGGDPGCSHRAPATGGNPEQGPNKGNNNAEAQPFRDICGICSARRIDDQLGLEPTPEQYVTKLVAIMREVRRTLRDDGTLWLNLGDCYASSLKGSGGPSAKQLSNAGSRYGMSQRLDHGLKEKDLVGIPWRVAFALQADGWWLRSDIVWSKPNPMPESVRDRPTRSHEYIFLLTKSARYYFDQDAVREPLEQSSIDRIGQETLDGQEGGYKQELYEQGFPGKKNRDRRPATIIKALRDNGHSGRNIRSVWHVATQPFPEAHFATFPPKLIEPCVKAGAAPGQTILDPFSGAGTTGLVANRLSRSFIGIDLNPEYCEMAQRRIVDDAPLFNRSPGESSRDHVPQTAGNRRRLVADGASDTLD